MLAERLKDTEALVLIRERTPIRAPLLERLPKLKLISQRSVYPHIDVDACTRRGIIVSSNLHPGTPVATPPPSSPGASSSPRCAQIPQQMASLKAGTWQIGVGTSLREQARSAFSATAASARVVAGYGKAFGMHVQVWGTRSTRGRARRRTATTPRAAGQAFFEECDVISLHMRLDRRRRAASSPPPTSRA